MSKGERNRKANAEKQQKKNERLKLEAKMKKVRQITAIITVSVILLLVLIASVGIISYNIRLNKGEYLRKEVAAATQNTEIDGAMMNYFFNDTYNTFVSYYGSYVSYFGLDTTRSLRKQNFSDGENWFDYFMNGAKATVENVLALNDSAKENGVSLTDAEIAAINSRVDNMDEGLYGRGVNKTDIKNAKLLEGLAFKYQFMKNSEFAPSEDDIVKKYEEDPKRFQNVDFYSYSMTYSEDGMSEDEVKAFASQLASAATTEDFEAIVKKILYVQNPESTEDQINSTLTNLQATNVLYTEGDEAHEWAFEAKVGQTLTVPDAENSVYTVYLLTKEAERDESKTVSVRHILLPTSYYNSNEEMQQAASDILEKFNAGEKTSVAFGLLALELSMDDGSYYNGGLYEQIIEGQMVTEFNDWCFDPSRRTGDTGIVETSYGCHVMYFEKSDLEAWKASVSDAIIADKAEAFLTEVKEKYPVVFDENVLDMIPD